MRRSGGYRSDERKAGDMMDEVLDIRMHNKVTKGGRNVSFAALVAVGDGKGKVGLGYGKAPGVPMAIEKANKKARQGLRQIPLVGDTVAHVQVGTHKASEVLLKPAAPGTGVKAGKTVRAIMSVVGIHNVLTKSIGRNNPINLARATMNALESMRSVADVEKLRGTTIHLSHPQNVVARDKPDEAAQQPQLEADTETKVEPQQ